MLWALSFGITQSLALLGKTSVNFHSALTFRQAPYLSGEFQRLSIPLALDRSVGMVIETMT